MFAIVRVLWILLSTVPLVVTANRYSRGALTAPRRSFFRAGAALVVGTGSAPVAAGSAGTAAITGTGRALGARARAGRGVVARLP